MGGSIDADAFELFKSKEFSIKMLLRLENILSKGGSDKPMNLYIQFRGRQPKEDALIQRSGLIPKK